MISYIVVGFVSGIVFGILDGLINANPLGRKSLEVYKPIARKTINVPAGIIIDLAYGFILAGIFVVLYESLPGDTGIIKGVSFGILAWFLRVIMSVISNWMTFTVPVRSLFYTLITGLVEMLVLGIIYGLFLKPWM